jgi:hypothetical protein
MSERTKSREDERKAVKKPLNWENQGLPFGFSLARMAHAQQEHFPS